ncbi:hypothetical protein LTR84_002067 [Exophiala bonariae]|uniref:Yeast cell wall synthesis Kre9/Knh1-like N-terminal domain-containing protein n=1 Tax=Exophiala bonariae TaxID=1690606 RepID=A0AAV9NA34_9EURO|nr:hypothetical protein LTR84_002067 [Exophiala bonariae]
MCTLAHYGAIALALLATAASGLEILSPTPGSGIDPTKPLSILWSVGYDDPASIDIKFTNANPNDVTTDLTLATGVASYTGFYTVPENTIQNFGTGYQILILSAGTTIASSTGLILGQSSNQVTTDANGQVTLISTAAAGTASGSALLTNSVPTASIESVGTTTLSGTATATDADADATTSATTSRASSFVTSTSSRSSSSSTSSSGQSSASATSAQSTNTANGQRRLGGELVLGAAGVLAGLVALLA